MTLHQPELTKQQIAYKAVRQRIWNIPAWKPKAPEAPKNVVLFEPRIPKPVWKEEETHFDAHVKQHQRRLVEMASNPAKVHIKDRCREIGISYREVVGPNRRKAIADQRHLLMWEIHQKFGLSYPAIGRLFGGRDHTSCLFAVRKIEASRATGAI